MDAYAGTLNSFCNPQDMHAVKMEGAKPSPRSAHAAVVAGNRYIVIFGGRGAGLQLQKQNVLIAYQGCTCHG